MTHTNKVNWLLNTEENYLLDMISGLTLLKKVVTNMLITYLDFASSNDVFKF